MSNLVGKQFGDYILERKFASGGMAHIYLGRDEKLGRVAAVKILTPDILSQDSSLAERFTREARAIARLEHDNIIPIYQYGTHDDHYFLVMRYVEGGDLAQAMSAHQDKGELMPVQRALFILMQVASALDHAHEHNIIHRDVKPSNVLIGANDKAFLSDFGLVLWQGVELTMGTAFGTPRYIAPEQASDSEKSSPASDVYSLAVVIYEILTGQVLFKGNTPMEVALAHITQIPIPPQEHNPKIPIAAQREILQALSKEPEERHTSAIAFIEALRDAYIQAQKPSNATQIITPDERDSLSERPTTPAPLKLPPTPPQPSSSAPVKKSPKEDQTTVAFDTSVANRPKKRLKPGRMILFALIVLVGGLGGGLSILPALLPDNTMPTLAVSMNITETPMLDDIQTTDATSSEVVTTSEVATATVTSSPTALPTRVPATPTATTAPTNTPIPTDTPTSTNVPTNVPIVLSGTSDLSFIYNERIFAIRNLTGNSVSLTGLRFFAERDVEGDSFTSTLQSMGESLAPNACVILLSGASGGTRLSDVPSIWNCGAQPRSVNMGADLLFWVADARDDASFFVTRNDAFLITCPTIGRAVGRVAETTCP